MKILQVCPKSPLPAIDGGCIAINAVTRGLIARGHEVKVLAIGTPKHPPRAALEDDEYVRSTGFETRFADTTVRPLSALAGLFSSRAFPIDRFDSPAFEQLIVSTLRNADFDVVQLESLYTAPYLRVIRRHTSAPIVYREHNVEHEIWEGTLASTRQAFRRGFYNAVYHQLKRYEGQILNGFDGIAAITPEDAQSLFALGCRRPIEVIPFGLDLDRFPARPGPPRASAFHLGSMDWMPNQEAMRFLLLQVWPKVHRRFPTATLHLGGRAMPEWLLDWNAPGVVVEGQVADAKLFMQSHGIMIVPLFSGSGMRIKIAEGLALGRAIVSTAIGATGIEYTDGRHLHIASTAEEFIERLCDLLENDEARIRLGEQSRALAEQTLDNAVIARRLERFYRRLIKGEAASGYSPRTPGATRAPAAFFRS